MRTQPKPTAVCEASRKMTINDVRYDRNIKKDTRHIHTYIYIHIIMYMACLCWQPRLLIGGKGEENNLVEGWPVRAGVLASQ